VKIRVSSRARTQIRAEDRWWRANRSDAPDLFKQELAGAFLRILQSPKIRRPHGQIADEPVWRILMPRAEQHVYYTVDEAAGEVVIELIWGARRGHEPRL
jgi:plasmid stabilization system protein ParE